MHEYTRLCTHTCTHTHTATHAHTQCIYTCMHAHTHTHTDWAYTTCRDFGFLFLTLLSQIVHVHECTRLCAHTHAHTHTHTPTHAHTQCTYTCMHTHTHTDWACTTCSGFRFLFLTLYSQSMYMCMNTCIVM